MTIELDQLAGKVGQRLAADSIVLATAESCTGGWVAKLMTDIPGSSAWFDRGFVTYSNDAKHEMLGVSKQTLTEQGAVSEAVVREMVSGALKHSKASLALSVSGIAGPGGGSPDKPVGTVWFAWGRKEGDIISQRKCFAGDRDEVRRQAVFTALNKVLSFLD